LSDFTIGKLAQVIHVVSDLAPADKVYRDVFGGDCFYSGYSPYEKRDASLLCIGDFTIEPMAPAADGADFPVGRFQKRFGQHLHSIALNVKGVPALYEHLIANDVRVFGPGGTDPLNPPEGSANSIFTHPKDSHILMELVDFGPELMSLSPRLAPDWDPTHWRDSHPLGIERASHITVVVKDVDAATRYFTDVLPGDAFHQAGSSSFVLLGEETVLELQQPDGGRAGADLDANGEIVHSVSLKVVDLDAAIGYLHENSIGLAERRDDAVLLDPADMFGALFWLTVADLPGDPRLL
jgi:hypothetical protein